MNSPSPALTRLQTAAGFYSVEAQALFDAARAHAGGDWQVDLQTCRIVFGDQFGADVHLLGSTDTISNTWRWAWSEVSDFSGPVIELAERVRDYGREHGVSELTLDEFPADDAAALGFALAAKRITGHWVHCPLQTGTVTVWTLLDIDGLTLPAPAIRPVVRALAAGVKSGSIVDHRQAVLDYAALRGFAVSELDDGGLRILFEDGSADIDFDERARLTNCQVSAPLAGEAADEFAAASPQAQSAPLPVDFSPVRAAAAPDDTPAQPAAEQPATEQPTPAQSAQDAPAEQRAEPKKKGLFGRLFGR